MKTSLFSLTGAWLAVAMLALILSATVRAENSPIPFSGIGAKATADYQGDALGVTTSPYGVRLRCGFQKLEGRATPEGLWLESTVPGGGEFRLVATTVRREGLECGPEMAGQVWNNTGASDRGRGLPHSGTLSCWCPCLARSDEEVLPTTGTVSVEDKLVRFTRPGVTEEYSVSVDGVRQDFVIVERPPGAGDLQVELALTGARAEAAAYGAKVILEGSGRALACSRLRATDATGQELRARLEVLSADRLALRVADANAIYPVRIDPTFSDANWVSLNPGMPGPDSEVGAIAVDGNGNVYVGGGFAFVGKVTANCIAKWNGSAWSALGSGIVGSSPFVSALAVSGTTLYAGGSFTTAGGVTANNIAKWNGSAWSALGAGMSGDVYALAMSGTTLYAGGNFTTAGGVQAKCIAKWNGSAWSALGMGMDSDVLALAVSGTALYAGGYFTTAGGVQAEYIAKWNGSAWSALGAGMDNYVFSLAVSGTIHYAGGFFTTAGGVQAKYIAKWNGSGWSALGSGLDFVVYALAVSGTTLYAGGFLPTPGGLRANSIAAWNGNAWSPLGAGMGGVSNPYLSVRALTASGSTLYAGGSFTSAGGVPVSYVAKWNGSGWSALGTGMNGPVLALAVGGATLYAAGDFTGTGGVTANSIAAWNGSAWSALGAGMNDQVNALAVSGTTLYAGGDFTTAGGVPAKYVARWDGTAWSALGSGVDGGVTALAVSGTTLYAGGYFTTAGGMPANFIAKWDGSAWSAMGAGMGGGSYYTHVFALAVSGTNLFAGGSFTTAGGVAATNIAKWNGSAWSALGEGMNYGVSALAVSGTTLYAGGSFDTAGGVPAYHIARWNGSAWSALGGGMYDQVNALAVSGTTLYAGGFFTTAGGVTANYIAAWNGSAWSALGAGMGGGFFEGGGPDVFALATDGAGRLFVGGFFCLAGTNMSPFIAQANIGAGFSAGRLGNLAYSPDTGFGYTFSDATIGQPYHIQTSPSLAAGSWTNLTNFTYTEPMVISDRSAAAGPKKFYRAVSP